MPKRHRRVSMKRWLLHFNKSKARGSRLNSDRVGGFTTSVGVRARHFRGASCSSRIIFGIPWRQAHWLLDDDEFLEPFGLPFRHRIASPSDGEANPDVVMPCGLRHDEIFDLMHRDIRPEDFELLSKLDDCVPNRNTAEHSLVETLPVVRVSSSTISECGVCLGHLVDPVVQLPCRHAFHQACISRWLTQCKNSCPLCSASIESPCAAKSSLPAVPGATAGEAGRVF